MKDWKIQKMKNWKMKTGQKSIFELFKNWFLKNYHFFYYWIFDFLQKSIFQFFNFWIFEFLTILIFQFFNFWNFTYSIQFENLKNWKIQKLKRVQKFKNWKIENFKNWFLNSIIEKVNHWRPYSAKLRRGGGGEGEWDARRVTGFVATGRRPPQGGAGESWPGDA